MRRRERLAEAMTQSRRWKDPMVVVLFKNRFADLIRDGVKTHTIRPVRKRPVHVGDRLSLRTWTGLPYRSKQAVIIEPRCTGVHEVRITAAEVFIDKLPVSTRGFEQIAFRDGFDHPVDMFAFFKEMHGLPFDGTMISWAID